MARITVFGGSGFIGRHVVRRLAADGWEIRVAVRDLELALPLKPAGDVGQIVPWCCDVTQPGHVEAAVAGADAVINLVGALYETGRNSFENVHVAAPKAIAEAAKAARIKTLIHMSALGADAASDSSYARSKAAGEAAVKQAYPEAVIMRPSVLFGPEDGFFNLFAGLSRFMPFLPVFGCPVMPVLTRSEDGFAVDFYGDGGTKFQPVYVGDVADAIVAALSSTQAAGQIYELGGPTVYSFKQLMEMLLRYTNRKRTLVPVPFVIAELEAIFLQILPKPILTRDQVVMLKTDNVLSGKTKELADLGVSPTTAESILPTYLSRFKIKSSTDRQRA